MTVCHKTVSLRTSMPGCQSPACTSHLCPLQCQGPLCSSSSKEFAKVNPVLSFPVGSNKAEVSKKVVIQGKWQVALE